LGRGVGPTQAREKRQSVKLFHDLSLSVKNYKYYVDFAADLGCRRISSDSSKLILRKLQNHTCVGRSSDLPGFSFLPIPVSEQWIEGAETPNGLTAAGTVADFHGIPYYPKWDQNNTQI